MAFSSMSKKSLIVKSTTPLEDAAWLQADEATFRIMHLPVLLTNLNWTAKTHGLHIR